MKFIQFCIGLLGTCALTSAQEKPQPVLQVAPNGRYRQWSDGAPFFIQSDTAWTLSRDYSREEVGKYLGNRRAQKFNPIQMTAVFLATPGMEAQIGEAFTDGDFANPDRARYALRLRHGHDLRP